jgi:hypothetical protein
MLGQPRIIDLNPRKGYSCNSGMQLSAGKHNEEMQRTKPPFRADQVGTSLPTPLLR